MHEERKKKDIRNGITIYQTNHLLNTQRQDLISRPSDCMKLPLFLQLPPPKNFIAFFTLHVPFTSAAASTLCAQSSAGASSSGRTIDKWSNEAVDEATDNWDGLCVGFGRGRAGWTYSLVSNESTEPDGVLYRLAMGVS